MGLLYIFPVSEEEKDNILFSEESVTLKSYGLPRIFWLYFLCSMAIIFLMLIAVKEPLFKLYQSDDLLNKLLVIIVSSTIILIPIVILTFFLYEKRITKSKNSLSVGHYILGVRLWLKKYTLSPSEAFEINHFRGTPNIARSKKEPSMRAFENQGYFELFAVMENGEKIFLDRNNKKADLVRISNILNLY